MNENEIFEMINADGEKEKFAFLATIEHEGDYYMAVEPLDPSSVDVIGSEDEDAGDDVPVIFFHCSFADENDPDADDLFDVVDDEALLETLFDKFLKMVEDAEDNEEDEEEADEE